LAVSPEMAMEREISVSGGVFLLLSLENVGGFLKWWIPKSPWVVKMFQYKNVEIG